MAKKIGVIAEDRSDVDVIESIVEKYIAKSAFSVSSFVGNGCGKVRHKCACWAETLVKRGCHHIILVHDRDRHDESELREMLSQKVPASKFKNSIIVIPVEELEAWLLSDAEAIRDVFSLAKAPKLKSHCETIASPKEHLRDVVWHAGGIRYLNTVHNKKISQKTKLSSLRKCQSFLPLDEYLTQKVSA